MVGGVRFGEVRFRVYPQDHEPRHVHGFIGAGEVVLDLHADRAVRVADRAEPTRGRVTRAEIRRVIATATAHFDELNALWEDMHG